MQDRRDLEAILPEKKLGLRRKYDTIAHDFLDIEAEAEFEYPYSNVLDSDYQILDEIIDEAKERIEVKPEYTKEEAIAVLEIIDGIFKDESFETQEKISLINQGLKLRQVDCKHYSFIYLAIAETINLPLAIVYAPAHIFVRWHFDKDKYFNWETTSVREHSDEYYKEWLNIADVSVEKGVFLKNLDKKKIYSIIYTQKGLVLGRLGRYEEAITNQDRALGLNQDNYLTYFNKGSVLGMLGKYKKAIKNYNKALKLNPNDPFAYNGKGFALENLGKHKKALECFEEAIKLDPDYALAKGNKRRVLNKIRRQNAR